MNDAWHWFATRVVDHLRWYWIVALLCVAASGALLGCEPKTASIINPDQEVTEKQLEVEEAIIEGQLQRRANELQRLVADLEAERTEAEAKLGVAAQDLQEQQEMLDALATASLDIAGQVLTGDLGAREIIGLIITGGLATFGIGGGLTGRRNSKKLDELSDEKKALESEIKRLNGKLVDASS